MEIRFQTISASVRPFRVAVLVDSNDPEWEQSCLAVSEFLSKLWGGGAGIIIPTDGKSIDELFWIVLMSYDPDIVLSYQKTGEDIRRNNPAKFEQIVAAHLKKFEEKYSKESETFRADLRDSLTNARADDFNIADDLSEEILLRLAPFHWEKRSVESINAGDDPNYPLTALIDVLEATDHPKQLLNMNKYPGLPRLWSAVACGYMSDAYIDKLAEKKILFADASVSNWTERDVIEKEINGTGDTDLATPSNFSQIALGSVRAVYAHGYQLPNLAIVGNSVEDFCLAYSLARMHDRVVWSPQWFYEEEKNLHSRFMTLVTSLEERGRFYQNRAITFISSSLAKTEIEAVIAPISRLYSYREFKIAPTAIKDTSNVVKYPIRHYEKGNLDKSSVHQLVDGEIPGSFDSPKLKNFRNPNAQKHRWLVELLFLKHKTPRHPALGRFILGAPMLDSNNTRSGRDGATYICPSAFVQGFDPDFNMVRPVVRIPSAFDIFKQALQFAGFDAETSDKGRYEAVMVDKLGGLEKAGDLLRDPHIAACFLKFVDQTLSQKGVHDEGVYLKKEGRRYLNFLALAKILGTKERVMKMLDDYISREVLYRGFIFGCEYCSNVEWFSVSEISHVFTCRRCGRTQQYKQRNWKTPEEPGWFYKLDEIVYLAVLTNCIAPILTLDALRRMTKQSFLHSSEIRINESGKQDQFMELDVCCICDGELTIGEVKTNGSLGDSAKAATVAVEKYLKIGQKIAATNYIFATSTEAWDDSSEKAIHSAFDAVPSLKYRILTKTDLFQVKGS